MEGKEEEKDKVEEEGSGLSREPVSQSVIRHPRL